MSNTDIHKTLKKYWGYDTFRPLQEDIIKSVLDRQHTLALLPTGGGKSLCYQLPALMLEGKTLVISPLVALMEDQVDGLVKRGVVAKALHSGLDSRAVDIAIDNWVHGNVKILFIAPERIMSPIFFERLKRVHLSMIAIDEAHCISQWGYDFRPSYFDIIKIKEIFPKVPMIALTATATELVITDIREKLGIQKSHFYRKSFLRSNLSIAVIRTEDQEHKLLEILAKLKGTGIIYQRNRSQTQYIAGLLAANGISATYYHGGLSYSQRTERQNEWMNGKVRIIVCTNAFGMGIDKPDVRFVIHLDLPPSIEEYYQEIGRAGRDGDRSYVVSILSKEHFAKAHYNHESSFATLDRIGEFYHKLHIRYKIPVGSGADETYPFDMNEFMDRYGFSAREVWTILDLLTKEGFVSMSEGFKEMSKVMVVTSGPQLNEMLRDQKNSLYIVHHMLRIYEGLFLEPSPISEASIAKDLHLTEYEVKTKLRALHRDGIIKYKSASDSPAIHFHRERLSKANFQVDESKYHLRKERASFRLSKMIEYFEGDQCRQQFILEYFGEEAVECGTCDVCLAADSKQYSQQDYRDLKAHLFKYLKQRDIEMAPYVMLWPYNRRQRIQAVIKILIQEGSLVLENGFLKKISPTV